jgi:hypothetical protein
VNLDELRPILHGYRERVEQAWSPATAHPGYEGKAGDPAGQCGVTSAWLQRRLLEDHGIHSLFCTGEVPPLRDHCWLEAAIGRAESQFPRRVVIDLTADQRFGHAVVCDRRVDLLMLGIDYQARTARTAHALLADPVQTRLAILTEALS